MRVRFYLPVPISVTISIFNQCLHLPHSLNIPTLLTAIPQRIISPIHFIGYTALFKKNPFTVTSGEMHCRAVMIHTDQILHLYFLVNKLT